MVLQNHYWQAHIASIGGAKCCHLVTRQFQQGRHTIVLGTPEPERYLQSDRKWMQKEEELPSGRTGKKNSKLSRALGDSLLNLLCFCHPGHHCHTQLHFPSRFASKAVPFEWQYEGLCPRLQDLLGRFLWFHALPWSLYVPIYRLVLIHFYLNTIAFVHFAFPFLHLSVPFPSFQHAKPILGRVH